LRSSNAEALHALRTDIECASAQLRWGYYEAAEFIALVAARSRGRLIFRSTSQSAAVRQRPSTAAAPGRVEAVEGIAP
jgi:hypothetical protein